MPDFWKFFTGVAASVVTYALTYFGTHIAGANVYLAAVLAGGFAAIVFYGLGHFLGYSTPKDFDH